MMDDRSSELVATYIHDDRHGPYLRAEINAVRVQQNTARDRAGEAPQNPNTDESKKQRTRLFTDPDPKASFDAPIPTISLSGGWPRGVAASIWSEGAVLEADMNWAQPVASLKAIDPTFRSSISFSTSRNSYRIRKSADGTLVPES